MDGGSTDVVYSNVLHHVDGLTQMRFRMMMDNLYRTGIIHEELNGPSLLF